MHRQVSIRIVLPLLLSMLTLCDGRSSAQQGLQTIPVVPPPSRRIEPPPANATPKDLDERGDELRAEKSYLDAIDYYQAALKKVGKKDQYGSVLLNKVGITQMQLTRFGDAKKSFEKAIKIDRTYACVYNNLGVVYYHDKKYGKAIKYYKRAIGIDPNSASYYSNLGSAYFSNKDMQDAVLQYSKALQLDPDIFERRSSVGIIAQMSSPEDRAHFSYVMAKMYAETGQFDRSLLYLRRAMEEGYKDINNVYQDQEFAKLRKDERFVALMSQPPQAIP